MDSTKALNRKALDHTSAYTASILCMEHKPEDAAIIAHGIVSAYLTALSAQGEAAQPAAEGWQDADTAPQTGFFLAWSPDFPDMVSCWKAEIFHEARKMGTPKHLSANHFTKWMPCPLPAASQGGAE